MVAVQTPQPLILADRPREKRKRTGSLGLLITFALKFSKFASLVKIVLFTASFGMYAVLLSWQFAVLILVSLFVHENGHIWAMRRAGMKTKGIYFLPFLGAAAVSDGEFPDRRSEAVIALMGPVWGLGLALLVAGMYVLTNDPLWAAASGWMAFINLFNLFPVNPLDGGRVIKSVAFSINSWLGIAVVAAGFLAALVLLFKIGLGLLVFILFIGGIEYVSEIGRLRAGVPGRRSMTVPQTAMASGAYLLLAATLLGLMMTMQHEPGAGLALRFLRS
jgi:Zn-dependent protease